MPQLCIDNFGVSPGAAPAPPRKSVICILNGVLLPAGVHSQSMYAPKSSLRVPAPAAPSTERPASLWKRFTAAAVSALSRLSIAPE